MATPTTKWTSEERYVLHLLRTRWNMSDDECARLFVGLFPHRRLDEGSLGLAVKLRDEWKSRFAEGRNPIWKIIDRPWLTKRRGRVEKDDGPYTAGEVQEFKRLETLIEREAQSQGIDLVGVTPAPACVGGNFVQYTEADVLQALSRDDDKSYKRPRLPKVASDAHRHQPSRPILSVECVRDEDDDQEATAEENSRDEVQAQVTEPSTTPSRGSRMWAAFSKAYHEREGVEAYLARRKQRLALQSSRPIETTTNANHNAADQNESRNVSARASIMSSVIPSSAADASTPHHQTLPNATGSNIDDLVRDTVVRDLKSKGSKRGMP